MKTCASKVLIWDIEADDVKDASFGTILCIGYKWLDEKEVHVISITDFPGFQKNMDNDGKVLQKFLEVYNKADYSVAHFGQYYDLPFVNTRLVINGLPTLAPTMIKDTWKTARKKMKLRSNRLEYIARALKCKHQKTPLDPSVWKRAMRGSKRDLEYVRTHCKYDVLVLEEVWKKIGPLESESLPAKAHSCDPK